MRHLTLNEYRTSPEVCLSWSERDALAKLAPSITITPSVGPDSKYVLTPGSEIGAVLVGDLAIEIQPKIPIDRVLFMVSYALDPKRWRETPFQFAESSLVEAVIPGFMVQVRRAFSRGVLQGYRIEEAALNTIRGRLRFDDQLRKRFGFFPPAEVRYDEFTEDIELNRLIKAAIFSLGQMRIRSDEARRSLRAFDSLLATVSLVHYDRQRLPDIHFNRLNEHYRPAVNLARLILRSMSVELAHGHVCTASFLIDMNYVFEDFVVVALREALGLSDRIFPQGAKGRSLRLDEAGLVEVKPDLSWWRGGRCLFVGDVKYKIDNADKGHNPDLYQLLAYLVATDLPTGILIYAAGDGVPTHHHVRYTDKTLIVESLDLEGTPEQVLQQINHLAEMIRPTFRTI